MKILFVASECAPIAKVGGLGDVIGSLPKALKKFDVDARIVIPKYEMINEKKWNFKLISNFYLNEEKINIWQGLLPKNDIFIYLLENKKYLSRGNIYFSSNRFYYLQRFLFFSRAVLEIFKKIEWSPDILHCHDWETAFVSSLLKLKNKNLKMKTILTIHNLSVQGKWNAKDIFNFLNLKGDEMENLRIRDEDGDFNVLQQGILETDFLTTVSPTYSKEILSKKYGADLEKTLRKNKKKIFGILNGIDTDIFNPATDPYLRAHYSSENFEKKVENKIHLQGILNLPIDRQIPLIGFIGRLTTQKGIDLFEKVITNFVQSGLQIIFLGMGSQKYEKMLLGFSKRYPKNISANIRFDPVLAQRIYAGADIFLIPSLFEPCGLIQMIAQRYGTIPVARATGGIIDTIEDGKTGFLFKRYKGQEFSKAIKRCLKAFSDKKKWQRMIKMAMTKDFSWKKSAKEYLKLYKKLLRK